MVSELKVWEASRFLYQVPVYTHDAWLKSWKRSQDGPFPCKLVKYYDIPYDQEASVAPCGRGGCKAFVTGDAGLVFLYHLLSILLHSTLCMWYIVLPRSSPFLSWTIMNSLPFQTSMSQYMNTLMYVVPQVNQWPIEAYSSLPQTLPTESIIYTDVGTRWDAGKETRSRKQSLLIY